jgi:hypothetical protein
MQREEQHRRVHALVRDKGYDQAEENEVGGGRGTDSRIGRNAVVLVRVVLVRETSSELGNDEHIAVSGPL